MKLKMNKIVIGTLLTFGLLVSQANAAFLCEGMSGGDKTDMSGTIVLQANGKIFVMKGGNYLVEINGSSNGVAMTSFVSFRPATYAKLTRCGASSGSKISVRVLCKKRGEPEVIQVVC